MAPRAPAEIYAEAVRFYGRHLVCLTGSCVQLDEWGRQVGGERLFGISAFVMSFDGGWFLVTAGHALKEGIDDTFATDGCGCSERAFRPTLALHPSRTHPLRLRRRPEVVHLRPRNGSRRGLNLPARSLPCRTGGQRHRPDLRRKLTKPTRRLIRRLPTFWHPRGVDRPLDDRSRPDWRGSGSFCRSAKHRFETTRVQSYHNGFRVALVS